jgi:hypothetical protein
MVLVRGRSAISNKHATMGGVGHLEPEPELPESLARGRSNVTRKKTRKTELSPLRAQAVSATGTAGPDQGIPRIEEQEQEHGTRQHGGGAQRGALAPYGGPGREPPPILPTMNTSPRHRRAPRASVRHSTSASSSPMPAVAHELLAPALAQRALVAENWAHDYELYGDVGAWRRSSESSERGGRTHSAKHSHAAEAEETWHPERYGAEVDGDGHFAATLPPARAPPPPARIG